MILSVVRDTLLIRVHVMCSENPSKARDYFRTGPFEKISLCVRIFRDFTEGEMGFAQRLLSHGTLTGKRPHYFSGPKSCHQLRTFSTDISPNGVRKLDHLFRHFLDFLLLQNLTFLDAARHLT